MTDWSFGDTWPYQAHWLSTDGLRIHYVDEGPRDGEPVVMLHGHPAWSYLYRHLICGLSEAGYRTIAHDQVGFGRSDSSGARRTTPSSAASGTWRRSSSGWCSTN